MGLLREDPSLRDRRHVFADRDDAGSRLATALSAFRGTDAIVLAIPSGGVPIGAAISRELGLPLDLLIVRKLQIPFNPEAGFGAMTPDGEVLLNEELVAALNLDEDVIASAADTTRKVLDQRNTLFRRNRPFPDCRGRAVIITDDGLASGYTMRAAVRWLSRMGPERIMVAVPTGSERTAEMVRREVDELVCLNVRGGMRFAVAEAYRRWYDLSDDEVLEIIARSQQRPLP